MRITAKCTPDGPRSFVTHADGSPADSGAATEALDPFGLTVAEVGDAGGDGDVVECAVGGDGVLRNPVREVPA